MNLSCVAGRQVTSSIELLVLFTDKEGKEIYGDVGALDRNLAKKLKAERDRDRALWADHHCLRFHPDDSRPAKTVYVIGLEDDSMETLRRGASQAAQKARDLQIKEAHVLVPHPFHPGTQADDVAHVLAEGALLGLYTFSKYKSEKNGKKTKLEKITMIAAPAQMDRCRRGIQTGQTFAEATCMVRDMINEPAMEMTPIKMAEIARQTAKGGIRVRVYDERWMKKVGMGGVLGVAAGSAQPPRFVHLTYTAPKAKKTVALVGKGITFDSGGLCIKTGEGMYHMKCDMSGAAAIVGVFSALSKLKPDVNVHGVFAATENMPGGRAYKTGDVLRAMNGKTMEIVNTDAEGRLILADGLCYASKLKPDEIIDMATLTGACVVALGVDISGIFSKDRNLVDRLTESTRFTGEKLWPMPLEDNYKSMIKSAIADIKNSGGRTAGSITAALFLQNFVAKNIPWAHIDIAGPAFTDSPKHYFSHGGTGVMVRTLLHYLRGA